MPTSKDSGESQPPTTKQLAAEVARLGRLVEHLSQTTLGETTKPLRLGDAASEALVDPSTIRRLAKKRVIATTPDPDHPGQVLYDPLDVRREGRRIRGFPDRYPHSRSNRFR